MAHGTVNKVPMMRIIKIQLATSTETNFLKASKETNFDGVRIERGNNFFIS